MNGAASTTVIINRDKEMSKQQYGSLKNEESIDNGGEGEVEIDTEIKNGRISSRYVNSERNTITEPTSMKTHAENGVASDSKAFTSVVIDPEDDNNNSRKRVKKYRSSPVNSGSKVIVM